MRTSTVGHIITLILLMLSLTVDLIGQSFPRSSTIRFTENRGQIRDAEGEERPELRYITTAPGMSIFFAGDRISYVLAAGGDRTTTATAAANGDARLRLHRVDLQLIGASSPGTITPEEPTADYTNYYTPHVPDGILRVPSCRRLLYRNVWPNIDIAVHGTASGLKYDFIVQPGGRVDDIRMRYVGADGVEITDQGSVRVVTPLGTIEELAPVVYQKTGSAAFDTIRSSYHLHDGDITFQVESYDSSRTLVIDPALEWSTFYGGDDLSTRGESVATDASGNVVMAGATISPTFPVTTGAFQGTINGYDDGFVARFTSYGERLWATYYGGNGDDRFAGVATGADGSITLCGVTGSDDFPISSGAFQRTPHGNLDGSVVCFDSNGTRLWGTYLGGSDADIANAVAVDASGEIVVAGTTRSTDFTVAVAAYQRMSAGAGDLFITRFSPGGTWRWGTYYGGTSDELAFGVAFDHAGDILVVGQTYSTDFPVFVNARQPTMVGTSTAFTLKLDRDGNRRWATFIGGTATSASNTGATGVATDSSANVIVTGWTDDITFTSTVGSFQWIIGGKSDGFLIKLDSLGRRVWATYIGGALQDSCLAVAVDRYSSIYLTGTTSSGNFPVTEGINPFASPLTGFVMSFDSSGRRMWGTYHGGAAIDQATGIAVDSVGAIFITGSTSSANLPVTPEAFQATLPYPPSAFLSKFGCLVPPEIKASSQHQICRGESQELTAYPGALYRWSTGETSRSITVRESGTYNYLWVDESGCVTRSGDITLLVHDPPAPIITGNGLLCEGDELTLHAGGFSRYRWSTGETTEQITVRSGGSYRVTVWNEFGCEGESDPVTVTEVARPTAYITTTRDSLACAGDSTQLRATGDFTRIEWSTGEATPTITVRQSGTYTARVWNDAGCEAAAGVTVRGYQWQPAIRPLGPLAFCHGEETTLATNADYTDYVWSTGERTSTITVGTSGDYWLQATDANGCTARSEAVRVTVHPLPPVPVITSSAGYLTCSTAPAYQWNRDGIALPGETSQTFTPTLSGSYTVTVTDANGCRSTSVPYDHDTEPSAAIALGTYQASPGDNVPVELRLTASRNLERNGITSFTAVIRYRASLLAPVDRSLAITPSGSDRLLTITNDVPTLASDGSGLLARIDFTALIGDTTMTPITVQSIVWNRGSVAVLDTVHGTFHLQGLCLRGGRRLVGIGEEPMLKPARPDPTNGVTEIEYAVVEDGRVDLFLVDALGRVIPLAGEETSPGRYVVQFDASVLSSGIYTCVLRTPTLQLHRSLHVLR